ncbi:MAG TPA: glycosyltransferase family 1 protein [Bryobacteraceae bacterium]|nr:glycosyltransferase family 1 protein [Bryobacteraceae bacterium]
MRIALDATYSLGKNLSGVGVYSREMMSGLTRAHPQQSFRFYYRPHRLFKSLSEKLPPNASRRLLTGAPRADLFHALNQRVDRRARRTVCTFHDLFVMTGEYSSPEFRARFTEQARQAAANSDAIIAVSQSTASQVEQLLGVEPSRIHVVPHGSPHGSPQDASVSTAAGAARRENLVLFVGVIQRRKNVGRLVKAFERLPAGWRLALAGASQGYGAAEELRAVEESPRRADIDVLGHLTGEQLAALYARARIFAFPSLDEGFGMPILEAMAHGVPVVTSQSSAMPEVAGDAALLVDPLNIDQLAHALTRLAGDQELRDDLIARGRARVPRFTWDSAVAQTWAVYEKVMGASL